MTTSFERSPQRWLRLGGALYLAIILLGLFGELLVRGSLVVPGNAQATFEAIRQSPLLLLERARSPFISQSSTQTRGRRCFRAGGRAAAAATAAGCCCSACAS